MTTLSSNELLDVLLCLDRYTIDALPQVSRMFDDTSQLMSADVCLRVIRYIDLHRWYPGTKPHEPLRRLVRCVSLRDVEGHKKYRLFMDPKPPKGFTRCNDVADALAKLKGILRKSYVKLLDIESSPEHPLPRDFVDSLLNDGRSAGVIRRLKLNVHMTIFGETMQKLPLLAGRIVEIDLCRCGELSPRAVTDGFLQRALSSDVLRLRASYINGNDTEVSRLLGWWGLDSPSDVREETILEFCFAKRDKGRADDGRRELWLNGLTLTPGFLRRFVEACNFSDHVVDVKAYLHGDVCGQHLSDQPWRWDNDDPERGTLKSEDVPLNVRIRRSENLLLIHRGPFEESVFESKRGGMVPPSPAFIDLPVESNTDVHPTY